VQTVANALGKLAETVAQFISRVWPMSKTERVILAEQRAVHGSDADVKNGSTALAAGTESMPIKVIDNGRHENWEVRRSSLSSPHGWRLELCAPDDRVWCAEAADVFQCLLELRCRVQSEDITICCNGARTNAWASGMLRQMSGGNRVYLLSHDRDTGLADRVRTLDLAPCEDIAATVAAQEEYYRSWLDIRRRNREAERQD
jgi:hypothetical protein